MKKKLLVGSAAILALVVAAVLVVPNLIDWNKYKDVVTAEVYKATGRTLTIDGNVSLSVLPALALVVDGVHLSSIEGAQSPDMVQLERLEVRISFGPLLGGNVQVETVRLVNPVIELERLADGRANWDFDPPVEKASGEAAPTTEAPGSSKGGDSAAGMPGVQLDNFTIENGLLVIRDKVSGALETVDDINATVVAGSISGPYQVKGSMTARGIPFSYQAALGEVIYGRTVPLSFLATIGKSEIQFSGAAVGLDSEPSIKGKAKIAGPSLVELVGTVADGAQLPPMLGQDYELLFEIAATAKQATIENATFRLGETQGSLDVTAVLDPAVDAHMSVKLGRIDLDKWMASVAPVKPAGGAGNAGSAPTAAQAPLPPPKSAEPEPFALPTGIAASIDLQVDAVVYRGDAIRQARLSAALAAGELTINQVAALLPGGSEVALFGFITAQDGKPTFDGNLEAMVSDLRAVLAWLGQPVPDVAPDRLRQVSVATKLHGDPDQVQLAGIDLRLDGAHLTGGVTVALRERPAFGADLTIDRLNLDAYLPKTAAAKPAEAGGAASTGSASAPAQAPAANDPFAALSALGTFDANVAAKVGELIYDGETVKSIAVDATLYQGVLTLRNVSIANAFGASAAFKGGVSGFGSGQVPTLSALTYDLRSRDLSRIFALLPSPPPISGKAIGNFELTGQADGPLTSPKLDLSLRAAGAKTDFAGTVDPLGAVPSVSGRVRVAHGDLASLLRTLDIGYRPAGPTGGIDLGMDLKANADAVSLDGINGRIGKTEIAGKADVLLAGAKPKLTASLNLGELVVDPFLPATENASLMTPEEFLRHVVPAAWRGPEPRTKRDPAVIQAAANQPRWSPEPLDLSGMSAADADIVLKAAAIAYGPYRLDQADLVATLVDGVLTAPKLTGQLYGGQLNASAVLKSAGVPSLSAVTALSGTDLARALTAVAGEAQASGRADFNLDIASSGNSVAQLVSSLGGKGNVKLTDVDPKQAKGGAMGGLLGLIDNLNRLANLGGGRSGAGLADVTGSFVIDKGVITTNDATLISNVGNGKATGWVNLPTWQMDIKGAIDLAKSVLTQVLSTATGTLPFQIHGDLDAPDVKLETGRLAIVPNAAKKALDKAGVGGILDKLVPGLGGGAAQEPAPSQAPPEPAADGSMAPPPPPSQPAQKPANPLEQLLRQIR